MDGNITAVLKRVEAMVGKTVKTPMSPNELPQDELPQDEFTDDES